MKKILITGAGGFIGSHLTECCVKQGGKVKAFIHYNSKNNRGWLEHSKYTKDIEFIAGDVRDFDAVSDAVKGCDTVFHLAALIGIPYSYKSPLAYIKTNVEGTYNILQATKDSKVKNVIVTSTSETYGTAQYVPIDEKHPAVAQSPYAASKVGADQLALSYYRSFDLPVKIVRPFNTYGPRQSARAIIPAIIVQILNGAKEIQLGNLKPTRDFTYVEDTVRGFLAVAKSKTTLGKAINIGMRSEISIENLAALITELIGKDVVIKTDKQRVRKQTSEVERLVCDNTSLCQTTDWKPLYDLKKGLKETIRFIEKNLNQYKADIYNV
ncbi:MAG: NAD-dependent 4,6-dehydratase LegB [Candidatus Omnitrophica bacterium]|nr:NAD-dependent 4,6-dehydratase LegB [Candidatus Omnitrophota bacterium]MCA9405964.1 NAD-dependent 4,6-dehydratase LegB [Candidatus Omnitrophota bacterium]